MASTEYTVQNFPMQRYDFPSTFSVGSTSEYSASCIDAKELCGKGWIDIYITSQNSAHSLVPTLQYIDCSVYGSILSAGQADDNSTAWAAFTSAIFSILSAAGTGNSWHNSIDWDKVEGRWVRVYIANNTTKGIFTVRGIAVGRKQET